ncbi:hypothetical protein Z948_537 [Sulfitobacter donghicola DSW-25 = KCTC 12864 = JCM 14565]|nr:hypothetical protein Z948_537 [Sulfitobacter donghicola DSW-25 = KCTC 12864 = JCM 14565]
MAPVGKANATAATKASRIPLKLVPNRIIHLSGVVSQGVGLA